MHSKTLCAARRPFYKKRLVCMLLFIAILLVGCASEEAPVPTPPQLSLPPPPVNSAFSLGAPVYNSAFMEYRLGYGSFVHMGVGDVCVPLANALVAAHIGLDDADIGSFLYVSNDSSLQADFIDQTGIGVSHLPSANISMDDTPFNLLFTCLPMEEAGENGDAVICEAVALDTVVFYVSNENPVSALTSAQLKSIYTGEITSWAALGGEDIPITAYQDGALAAKNVIAASIMQGAAFVDAPSVEETMPSGITGGDAYTVSYISSYENAPGSIGYGLLTELSALFEQGNIQLLTIDGAAPSDLSNGAYPLSIALYATIWEKDQNKVPGQFLNWLLSDDGRTLIKTATLYQLP